MIKKILKFAPLVVATLITNGCKDTTYYMGSDYKQINISELQDIKAKGYRLDGGGYNLGGNTWNLFFCKNNKYAYTTGNTGAKIYYGHYNVDLANDQVVMHGDDVDNQGKKLHGIMKTPSGYFEQEKKYVIGGNINIGFEDLQQINSSNCDIKKEAF